MKIEVTTAHTTRAFRKGAPTRHPMDGHEHSVHIAAVERGSVVGGLSAVPTTPSGTPAFQEFQLWGPFGEHGAELVEALDTHLAPLAPCTVWADTERPGLTQSGERWTRTVQRSQSSEGHYSTQRIVVLDGPQAIRRRPTMYLGSTGSAGVRELVLEIINNCLDEHVAGCAGRAGAHRWFCVGIGQRTRDSL